MEEGKRRSGEEGKRREKEGKRKKGENFHSNTNIQEISSKFYVKKVKKKKSLFLKRHYTNDKKEIT